MTTTRLTKIKLSYPVILLSLIFFFSGFSKEIIIIISTIFLHELGHLLVILLFKGNVKSLTINLFGGRIDADMSNIKNRWQKLLVDMGRNYYKSFNYFNFQ